MRSDIDGVMLRLERATSTPRSALAEHPLQRDLAAGLAASAVYTAWLGQLFVVHRALERHLARLRCTVRPLAAVVRDWHFHAPRLDAELASFAVDVRAVVALPATAALVARIDAMAARSPLALLGVHYALEQRNAAGRHVGQRLHLAYGRRASAAGSYFDPYGPDHRQRWLELKAEVEASGFSETEVATIASAAAATLGALAVMMDEALYPPATVSYAEPAP